MSSKLRPIDPDRKRKLAVTSRKKTIHKKFLPILLFYHQQPQSTNMQSYAI